MLLRAAKCRGPVFPLWKCLKGAVTKARRLGDGIFLFQRIFLGAGMAKLHPLQRILYPLLLPVSFLYGWGGMIRRRLVQCGRLRQWKPSRTCVSIGNISWGGTGKTPVTDWILERASRQGKRAAVLTRGYGAHPSSLPLIVTGNMSPSECGDEPLMLAAKHSDAVVVVDPDRNRAGKSLECMNPPDFYILDDGFQHLSTGRDLDIVLLDKDDVTFTPASNWNRIIPAGSWREPEDALSAADVFLIKVEPEEWPQIVPAIRSRLKAWPRPVFAFHLEAEGLMAQSGPSVSRGKEKYTDASALQTAYAFVCGIGSPEQAVHTVTRFFGRPPEQMLSFPDHHDFRREKERLESMGLPIVCTGKDAVKLASLNLSVPLFSLEVSARFFASLNTDGSSEEFSSEGGFESWWDSWLFRHLG